MEQVPEVSDQQIRCLRSRVLDVLNQHSVKSCIKQALLSNGGPSGFDTLEALQQLQVCGVLDQVVQAAAADCDAAQHIPADTAPGQQTDTLYEHHQHCFRSSQHCLHVVVKGGRAFTEYLTRPTVPGEQLQLHLLLFGQRIASTPVLAATSPAFGAEAVIRLPAAPASGVLSHVSHSSPAKSKAPWVFAAAADADTADPQAAQRHETSTSRSVSPELQHLLQLRERLHVVVVRSCPAEAPAVSSYTAAAAAAAEAMAQQQQQQQQQAAADMQGQHVQQLCSQSQLYGVGEFDWRKALCRRKGQYITLIELRPGSPDELQSSAAVGAVELHLQLLSANAQEQHLQHKQLPVPSVLHAAVPESVVRLQQQCELRAESEAMFALMKRAKAWWAEYLAINPRYKHRNIKVLARCEASCQHPVTAWLTPLQLGRYLSTAAEAARFVALLTVREELESLPGASSAAGSCAGCWSSLHTCLAARQGSQEELALVLCSLLLGFGLDAWVAAGRLKGTGYSNGSSSSSVAGPGAAPGAPACWVLVYDAAAPDSSLLWEPTTGQRYGVRDLQSLPLASIDSLFNHKQLLANTQADNSPAAMSWLLHDDSAWLPLDMSEPALRQPLERLACPLRPPNLSPWRLEQQLEQQIMAGLAAAQQQLLQDLEGPEAVTQGGSSSRGSMLWDAALAHIIMMALAAYETEALLGMAPPAASEVAAAIRRATPAGHVFKGIPQHHRTLSAPIILDSLLALPLVQEMLLLPVALGTAQQRVPQDVVGCKGGLPVVYALRVKVTMYPEDLPSVWLMFAVKYSSQ